MPTPVNEDEGVMVATVHRREVKEFIKVNLIFLMKLRDAYGGARVGEVGLKGNTEKLSMPGKIFCKVINIVLEKVKQHSTIYIQKFFLTSCNFFDQRHSFRQMCLNV